MGETNEVIPEGLETDPQSYDEAINDADVEYWAQDIESELESMYFNKVVELIEVVEVIKPIGCKST